VLASPLLRIFLAPINDKIRFAEVFCKDPSHAGSRTVRKGFVLGLHACSPNGVGILTFDSGDVVIAWIGALETLMIDIVAT
jgi:hypothetical protein